MNLCSPIDQSNQSELLYKLAPLTCQIVFDVSLPNLLVQYALQETQKSVHLDMKNAGLKSYLKSYLLGVLFFPFVLFVGILQFVFFVSGFPFNLGILLAGSQKLKRGYLRLHDKCVTVMIFVPFCTGFFILMFDFLLTGRFTGNSFVLVRFFGFLESHLDSSLVITGSVTFTSFIVLYGGYGVRIINLQLSL